MTVRVGLIGYGYSGATFQAPLIKAVDGLLLTHVCSSNPDKVLRDFPGMTVLADPAALIASPEVDLVVVATNNATHFPLARAALLAGKHVVVEKPFTVTLAEAAELVALAESEGVVLSVFHNRRWDNDFLTLRQTIDAGLLGPINTYTAHFDRYRPGVRKRWREDDLPGSGILFDLGSHLVDQALVLFGNPDTVQCDIGVQRAPGGANDFFHMVLRYGARRVILHAAMVVAQPGPHFAVHGELGSFIKHGLDPQEPALLRGEGPASQGWGVEAPELHAQLVYMKDALQVNGKVASLPGAYQRYYEGIREAVARNKAPPVTGREALAVMRILTLAMQSHAEQRTVPFVL